MAPAVLSASFFQLVGLSFPKTQELCSILHNFPIFMPKQRREDKAKNDLHSYSANTE